MSGSYPTHARPALHPRVALLAVVFALACGSSARDEIVGVSGGAGATAGGATAGGTAGGGPGGGDGGGGPGSGPGGTSAGSGGGGVKFDVGVGGTGGGDGGGGECPDLPPSGDAKITGRVFAPNGELPISGALVWVEDTAPEGVPDHVYCQECVELACDTPNTFTAPDGTFELQIPSGTHWIMVQKGQFLRATQVQVAPGDNSLDAAVTTLPSKRDPAAGEWIPNIALGWAAYDRLENGLAKLGLAQASGGTTFQAGTASFDIYANVNPNNQGNQAPPPPPETLGSFASLLKDPAKLEKYHIIFVPCTSTTAVMNDPAVVDNVRDWVAAGGKWYVSDWSADFIEKPFSQYQVWWEYGGSPLLDSFDSDGTVLDGDLLAWLDALPPELKDINPYNNPKGHPTLAGLPQIELRDLWTTLRDVPPVWVDDGQGGYVNVGHKVWIEGPGGGGDGAPKSQDWPLTVTGEYGCGKILFTSYHTVEWVEAYKGLTPQELVLMYLILEIGVCQTGYEPPPPVG